MNIQVFEKPLLRSGSISIGGNKVILHEINGDDYYNFVLDEGFAEAVIKAHGESLSDEPELTETQEVYQKILKDQSHNYRLIAASMLSNHVDADVAFDDRKSAFEEIEKQLRSSLSADHLKCLVAKVSELMAVPVPKKDASIENSSTDSPAS